jgi:hypothetical protein
MAIELSKASEQEVSVYNPYYREPNKRQALPYAISLYKQGEIAGERHIEGSPTISFIAVWRVTSLPLDPILCRVTFSGDVDMSYEIELQNAEFVGYLIDIVSSIRDKNYADFPQVFYSKLFRMRLAVTDGN